jgi:hypothetical protein
MKKYQNLVLLNVKKNKIKNNMNFHINKNATLPIMKLDVINNGKYFNEKIYELLQNADIRFTMTEYDSGKKVIANKPALLLPKSLEEGNDEYYIGYQFNKKETDKRGRYIGEFIISFLNGYGDLIVPIKNTLYINVS